MATGSTESDRAKNALSLLDETVNALRGGYRELASAEAECSAGTRRTTLLRVLSLIAGVSARSLAVVYLLLERGWTAETFTHVRTVYEYATDAYYILAHNRLRRAELYSAAIHLRIPGLTDSDLRHPNARVARQLIERARADAGSEVSTNRRDHWTGRNRGDIRLEAWGAAEGIEPILKDVGKLKNVLFDLPSSAVHGDPGSIVMGYLESGGLSLYGTPNAHRRIATNAILATMTGTMVLRALAEVRALQHKNEAKALMKRLMELAQE